MQASDGTDIETLLADITRRSSRLNEWETAFIKSVKKTIESGTPLSKKQIDKIEEVWERVT